MTSPFFPTIKDNNQKTIKMVYGLELNGIPYTIGLNEAMPYNLWGLNGAPSIYKSQNKDSGRLFHDQVILYGSDPFDASGDFNCFIDGLLSINKTAQLNNTLESFDTNLE